MRHRLVVLTFCSVGVALAPTALQAQENPIVVPNPGAENAPAPGGEVVPGPGGENPPPLVNLPPALNEGPPPLPPLVVVQYFVAINNQQAGPFDLPKLTQMVTSGELKRTTLVWKTGMAAWGPAEKEADLAPLFANTAPALPFDCPGHLVGAWERSETMQGMQLVTRSRFDASGQFQGDQSMDGMGAGSGFYGTWTGTAVGEKSCSYTFNYAYPGGSNTAVFDIVDRNNMTQKGSNATIRRIQ